MRIIFMGSPKEVITPCQMLMEFCQSTDHDLIAVVSQPAKPAGRRKKLSDPPLATWALEQGIKVIQPAKARDPQFLEDLRDLKPDLVITAAYGQILTEEFLAIPSRGTINIHPSLLPEYRGASPVQTALFDGREKTGVTILFTVRALDSGHIIVQKPATIEPLETADSLLARMFRLGGEALLEAVKALEDPDFIGTPQDESQVTHCHKFEKASGVIDWSLPNKEIVQRYQAFKPWPGTFAFYGGKRVLIEDLEPIEADNLSLNTGEFIYSKGLKALLAKTKDGYLRLNKVKPEGSKLIDGAAFWNGLKLSGRGQFDV
ncbi:methionyl-tRNA formyltransferase [Pseudobacteriovorax antillogorgiicola]|uniref:Methionyl-tRNA formyltransferase n=1 Tax=Pseudobacteriovorax antillogorgiicola TaxID=1513793 RepID=A0A1Y6CQI7_9BACT|nr:methionyl-tRNA formyltransferase [Pseudobacteriovorax antillogorgiicola]TCS46123.1 methionyl-tRNA formyltransferase [Pseudobacteriovorax antillogorgiicola]SMF69557.1 methionyl-tRNA formyltransferase [Pseudobacteriovorax antillogorgiicola]